MGGAESVGIQEQRCGDGGVMQPKGKESRGMWSLMPRPG